jgi:hypothetical protein
MSKSKKMGQIVISEPQIIGKELICNIGTVSGIEEKKYTTVEGVKINKLITINHLQINKENPATITSDIPEENLFSVSDLQDFIYNAFKSDKPKRNKKEKEIK